MNKKKVLTAFDSKTMQAYIYQMLKASGYDVINANDGAEALDLVFTERPCCVLVYVDIPVIGSWDLSRIIKNTPQLRDTSVLVCSSDNLSAYNFWKNKSHADGIIILDNIDAPKLSGLIENTVQKNAANIESADKTYNLLDRKDIVRLVSNASANELFNLYITQTAYSIGTASFGVEGVADAMIGELKAIFNYDAVGIIFNDESLIERYDYNSNISVDDFKEFRHICHKDFESKITNRKNYNWEESTIKRTRFESEKGTDGKLKSYECFPRNSNGYITIHVASCDEDAFNKRFDERINFFTDLYGKLARKNIYVKKVSGSEQKMRKAFSRFVPATIIDDIIAGNEQTDMAVGEKRQVAILISDIRNFTTISEINEPANVVNFLNYYFSVMGKIIKRNGGTIDKFMGDAIMVLFGAPESFDDNGNRAAQTALEMMEAMKTIDTKMLKFPGNTKFEIGIGIHYGTPIVGSIGSQEKRDYTVIGDDVNLASRVEGLTKLYGVPIIITDTVKQDLLDGYNGNRLLDKVRVKGKSYPVEIFELIAEKDKYSNEFLSIYDKGFKQYVLGNFGSATEYFNQAIEMEKNDKASIVLQNRCNEFISNPPEQWDGAIQLTNK